MPVEVQLAICTKILQNNDPTKTQPKPGVGTWQSSLENHSAFGGLAVTCKHFQAITAAPLYRRVKVSIREPASFIRLIRHFSQFPNRAALVNELTIRSNRAGSPLSKSQKNFLFREAHRLGIRLLIGGHGGLSRQLESILIDVLLCQLCYIRNLSLCLPWTTTADEERCPMIFDEAEAENIKPFLFTYASRLPVFFVLGSLQRLEAYPMNFNKSGMAKLHTGSLTSLLRHTPALTHLVIGTCDQEALGHGIIQNLLPQLRDIHLVDALDGDLAAITNFCPRLERLRLGQDERNHAGLMEGIATMLGFQGPMFGESRPSATPKLLKALLPMKDTLHGLDLDCDTFRAQQIGQLAQLSHFANLRSLRLVFGQWPTGNTAALINKLSPHLEFLYLGGTGIPVNNIAALLIGRILEGRLPRLRQFAYILLNRRGPMGYVPVGDPLSVEDQRMSPNFQSILRGHGVDCIERSYPRTTDA
jgi:hypothetical protein